MTGSRTGCGRPEVSPHRFRRAGEVPVAAPAGIALVLTLVILVALTVLAHGALLLARAEGRAAEALRMAVERRLVGRAALGRAVRVLAPDTLPLLAVASADTAGDGDGPIRVVERLAPELFLLTVSGELPGGERSGGADGAAGRSGAWAAATLLWAVDPLGRAEETAAVLSAVGEVVGGGDVTSTAFFEISAEDGPGCAPWESALDSIAALRPPPLPVGRLSIDPADRWGAAGAAVRVERLPMDSVIDRLDSFPSGTVSPRPVAGATACFDDAENWGSPTDPDGPCGGRRVAIAVDGSLVVDGGEGQGVWAVAGDLTLRDGAYLSGLLLVGGDLRLEEGSLVRGTVRVGGRVAIATGSLVEGAACPLLLSLAAAPGLRRPLRLPEPLLSVH